MRYCGQISIEFPAEDYFSLADHRERLEDILAYIRTRYPDASLALRERRNRRALPNHHAQPRAMTGALNQYAQD
jgi:hypothetical protein